MASESPSAHSPADGGAPPEGATRAPFLDCAPIFVVGSGRSGTTMLQLMLNAHPNISVMGELHFFSQIGQLREMVPDLTAPGSLERLFTLVKRVEHYRFLPDADAVFGEVRARLEREAEPTYELLFRYVLEEYARREGATRFGEKTPDNVRYLPELVDIFPKAKIIHITRDPRAVVASAMKMPGASTDVVVHAVSWRADLVYGAEFRDRKATYREVRYEDLVTDPEPALRGLCEFLGEDYVPSMLDFHRTARSHLKDEPWKMGAANPVNTAALEKWKTQLSGPRVLLIELLTGDLMDSLRYTRQGGRAGDWLLLPFVLAGEVGTYVGHRLAKRVRARRAGAGDEAEPMIRSTRTKVYRKVASPAFFARWR